MDERMDLTGLELSATERERLVASIMARTQAELRRRQALDVSPIVMLSAWMRPALAAAAVLAALCVPVLALSSGAADSGSRPAPGLADALAVPQPADEWLVSERAPTVADLFVAMEVEGR